jgi:hypothetical protein
MFHYTMSVYTNVSPKRHGTRLLAGWKDSRIYTHVGLSQGEKENIWLAEARVMVC